MCFYLMFLISVFLLQLKKYINEYRNVKHLLLRKSDFQIFDFLEKFFLKKWTNFEEQKVTRNIQGNVYFGIIVFSCLSSTNLFLRFFLIFFAQEIKGFYQKSLGNEVDLIDIMNVSSYILAKN